MSAVSWTASAIADLRQIRDHLATTYLAALAQNVIRELILATDFLVQYPAAGPVLEDGHWRKWKPRKTRYVLIYRTTHAGVEIARVRHERNDWRPVPR